MKVPAGMLNPFRTSIVADPWGSGDVDVAEIHAQVFADCCRAVEHVRATGRSTGLLVHGEAGSGKTHLLARLRAHLTRASSIRNSELLQQQVFVSIRLQTSPQMIWRHVRRRFAEDLLRRTEGGLSQLEQVLSRRLAEWREATGDLELWWDYLRELEPAELDELLSRLDEEPGSNRNLTTVLGHLARGNHPRDVRSWLRGEPLPESALARLDLPPAREGEDDQETEARHVVQALCRLAGPKVPIIFCFDQVEALQVQPDDLAGLFAFGQLVRTMHDETQNLLLISCMQSAFLTLLADKIRAADYSAVREYGQRSLNPLSWEQAVRLLAARLESVPDWEQIRPAGETGAWPFTDEEIRRTVGEQGCTPRRLLSACAERFDELETAVDTPTVPPQTTEEFLQQDWERRLEAAVARNTPELSQQILTHGLPLLMNVAFPHWKQVADRSLPDVDCILADADSRIGVSVCTQANMTSLAGRLRRLRTQLDGPARGQSAVETSAGKPASSLQKLFVIRDGRTPISSGAEAAQRYLKELEKRGVSLIRPAAETLAALDALRELLSDTRAGDLSHRGETLAPQTVQQWLARTLPFTLQEFLESVTGAPRTDGLPDDSGGLELLTKYLQETHVASVADAAANLGLSAEQLEGCARRHPDQFGLLCGPPAVLFEILSW